MENVVEVKETKQKVGFGKTVVGFVQKQWKGITAGSLGTIAVGGIIYLIANAFGGKKSDDVEVIDDLHTDTISEETQPTEDVVVTEF